ncbi:MAG: NAD(P)/FAD-dependent oxidoreductase [bacterium]|nr:NAD(P)/FAD-dependent oxidoreductase [bacterium]
MKKHHVVIIGGGFGGLHAALAFKKEKNVKVTLIDRRNFHLFQPLLYQVATGGLSPGDIASPLRAVFTNQKNTQVVMGEVIRIDVDDRMVVLRDTVISYDTLIVATGVAHSYFGHDEWSQWAPGLKTIEDATEMRRRIFVAFESAEREDDPELRRQWLNFVIVGGGPTGVELAGAVSELAYHTLVNDFRTIDPKETRIVLAEGAPRLLPPYPEELSKNAEDVLTRRGVEVKTNTFVTDVQQHQVTMKCGDDSETFPTRTVLWAAGVKASPMGKLLADRAGAELDKIGRVKVNPDLTVPGHPEIMVLGDLANCPDKDGNPLPGVAPVAMQQGDYAADLITARVRGEAVKPFRYVDRGAMAVIGRNEAVAHLYGWRVTGFFAWLIWLFVHILNLIEYDNRLLVAVQWAWNYFTRNRGARLITHQPNLILRQPKNEEDWKRMHEESPELINR